MPHSGVMLDARSATSAAESAISLTAVTKRFSGSPYPKPGSAATTIRAVDSIDINVPTGQILALLGPNGAGKTTTLDMISGLTEPTSGTVLIQNARPAKAVADGRISAVLQTGGLLRDLSVAETVRMIASTFTTHLPVDDALERAGIAGLARRKVAKCSGGEQQRLRFALALLPDPDVLILDEPTAGMDVTARQQFWDTMHTEAARGRTIVFATHYLQEADAFAERIVLMDAGRIVADGSTSDIRAHASGRTVSARIEPARTEAALTALAELTTVRSARSDGERVIVDCHDSDAVALALLTELNGHQLEIAPASLDQAFMTLTGQEATP